MTDILPDRDELSQQMSTKAGELQLDSAHAWYHSADYQRLKALRVDSSHSQVVLTDAP